MGRIAEALKRAQQERTRRSVGGLAAPDAVCEPTVAGAGRTDPRIGHQGASPASLADVMTAPSAQPFIVSAAPIVPDQVAPEVIMLHDPGASVSERYRSARTRLLTSHADGGSRVFAVTSALPQEGKTVTTANLAFSLAEMRHLRVAMIDCDFRRRGLSASCQVKDRAGLAEVIRGEKTLADVCVPVVRDNLFLIPAGHLNSSNPSELLTGAAATHVFREINDRFHYGLIDTPPTGTVADIGLVAPLCHAVVIVIRLGKTPEHLLQRCVRMLQANRVAIAGSILVGYSEKTMAYTDNHDYYEGRP